MRFMERRGFGLSPIMVFVFLLSLVFVSKFSYAVRDHEEIATKQSQLQTYIVHIKEPEGGPDFSKSEDLETWYKSFLPATSTTSNSQQRLVYSYRNVLTGFAAKLTQEEVKPWKRRMGCSGLPEKIYHFQITHSPAFLGLHQNSGFWNGSNYGKGVIIAVVDSGISSHHPSFSDEGMPPPPAKWKGKCAFNGTICNNKIINHSDPFYVDEITIGAFAATRKGIFVSTPAGNEGPRSPSLSNGAPWVLTVGASTIDRSIRTTAKLGNGEYFDGESFFQLSDFPSKLLPLVYAGPNGNVSSAFCNKGSLKRHGR
ncbi:Subtilisin-like protease SBT1.4 [Vitis vinifera]|uniref:Subtilisin-like protease SBT1.4 n=1 Tax=Vitis vinifera TaxID=29760 RepID=A0A438ESJ7_VITVI|nr:Subtilisin-like protease SBT1.4 [Vitis vinifera]